MVKYICDKCKKEFNQKGNYTKHMNKKKPCFVNKEEEIKCNIEFSDTSNLSTTDYTIIHCCCIKGLTNMKNENKTPNNIVLPKTKNW